MIFDKSLGKIQDQIHELAPVLELFLDEKVRPTTDDCEELRNKLTRLQDTLAVYSWHRREVEISPSFNIHAAVSKADIKEGGDGTEKNLEPQESTEDKGLSETKRWEDISVGINDKFRIINELFLQKAGEYSIAMEQLNSLTTWSDAENYLNSLRGIYNWNERSEVTLLFYALAKKRFM